MRNKNDHLKLILCASITTLTLVTALCFQVLVAQIRLFESSLVGSYHLEVSDGSPSVSIGNFAKEDRSVYFRASIVFQTNRPGTYPNLMQTDDGNDGVRIELADQELMVLVGKGDGQNFYLPLGKIGFAQKHQVQIVALENGYVRAKLDNQPWQRIENTTFVMPGRNFRVGDGHVRERRWQGDISSADLDIYSTPTALYTKNFVVYFVCIITFISLLLIIINWKLILDFVSTLSQGVKVIYSAFSTPVPRTNAPIYFISAIVLVVTALYCASYSFGYFPITEGWYSVYVDQLKQGAFPYRDVNFLLTPFYLLTLYWFDILVGDSFWALRVFGVVVTASIGCVTFHILLQVFDRWVSAFASIIAAIYYQSGNAYIGYDFTQIVTLFMLLGCYGAVKYSQTLHIRYLILCGLTLSLATLTKQSNGGIFSIGMTVVLLSTVFYLNRKSFLTHVAAYFASAIIPAVSVMLWLILNEAFSAFLEQTVTQAISAKGGADAIASGWIRRFFLETDFIGTSWSILTFFLAIIATSLIATLLLAFAVSVVRATQHIVKSGQADQRLEFRQNFSYHFQKEIFSGTKGKSPRAFASSLGIILISIVIFATKYYPDLAGSTTLDIWSALNLSTEYHALGLRFVTIAFSIYCIGAALALGRTLYIPDPKTFSILLICVSGLLLMVSNGSSAALSEISAFLGIAVLVAAALSVSSRSYVLPLLTVLVTIKASQVFIIQKYSDTYSWWGISTGELQTSNCARLPSQLDGICISEKKAKAIQDIVNAIDSYTPVNGRVLSFPNTPIFTHLADRLPYGRSPIPWFDFMSQEEGSKLLVSLKQSTPDVVVVARVPPFVFDGHEVGFNGGEQGIHRKIQEFIDELSTSHRIQMVSDKQIDGINVQVYRRLD